MRYEAEIAILMQDRTWYLETIKFNVMENFNVGKIVEKFALEEFRSNANFIQPLYNSGWSGIATVYSFKQLEDEGRVIKLPCFDIVVELDSEGSGTITSSLHEDSTVLAEEDVEYHAAIDALESIIMAHAVAGIDIETPAYLEGIETAVNAISHNFPLP